MKTQQDPWWNHAPFRSRNTAGKWLAMEQEGKCMDWWDSFGIFSLETLAMVGLYEIAIRNLLYMIEMPSYSTLLCTIKSAALVTSANVGVSQPIWLNIKAIFFPTTRDNCPFHIVQSDTLAKVGHRICTNACKGGSSRCRPTAAYMVQPRRHRWVRPSVVKM